MNLYLGSFSRDSLNSFIMRKNLYSLCFLLLALTAFFTHRSYAQYCTPTFTTGTTSGDFIDGVILNTISNTGTGGSVPPYTDYSATLSTTLIPSTTYTITFNNNPTWTEGYEAWIDYNQNQSFEPSESCLLYTSPSPRDA